MVVEQKETDGGYIFYVNKKTGERQNDNPKLLEIMQVIRDQHKYIKYVTYRCATKIWLLKQSFYTVNIPYNYVTAVLNHFGLNQCDNAPSLKPSQLTSLLHDIYFAAEKCGHFSQCIDFNLERCTAMLANLLWSIFDTHRTVPISLLEFKQLMLIMCNTQTFDQMILEEFLIVADHNRCVNRFRFESLLKVISKIFSFLGESAHYGWHLVTDWVQQCFQQCPGIIGLDEYQFTCLWQNQTIHFATYSNVLALVHRIKESQNILHDVQCISCKATPITGIRFKCQHCRRLSLCFECFCKGFTNARHEISHRMYEMSTIRIKSNKFYSIASKLWRCACGKSCDSAETQNENNLTLETKIADEKNQTTGTTTIECINDTKFYSIRKARQLKDAISPLHATKQRMNDKLEDIIESIAHQANQMQEFLATTAKSKRSGKVSDNVAQKFLQQHQLCLNDAIGRLREIAAAADNGLPHASTPYRTTRNASIVQTTLASPMRASIRGAAINQSFLENNRSDLSVGDLSTWFHQRTQIGDTSDGEISVKPPSTGTVSDPIDNTVDSDMHNFKELLAKIREIMEDSYSDNVELSSATRKLEHALDDIIEAEEQKRTYL